MFHNRDYSTYRECVGLNTPNRTYQAQVTRTTEWISGQVLTATALNTEFNNLLNSLNLVNADISSSAAITPSKIVFGGASGQFLQSNGSGGLNYFSGLPAVDGWQLSSDTWIYASANSFTITGVDRTLAFTKGTRVKMTISAAIVYGVVASSSFSSNTTVNLIPNDTYVVSNATISNPFYSYVVNPQGFPYAFAFTNTITYGGFSANPVMTTYWSVVGNVLTMQFFATGNGTSNANTTTFSLPVASAFGVESACLCPIKDNGTVPTAPGQVQLGASSATANVFKTAETSNTWTTSGTKLFYPSVFSYVF